MPQNLRNSLRSSIGFIFRSAVLHVLTYYVIGAASYWLVARRYWTGPDALPWVRNPEGAFVQRWQLLAQIVRGALHGIALVPLKEALLGMGRWGGLVVASLLLLIGSVAGTSGLIEGLAVYHDVPHGPIRGTPARNRPPNPPVRLPPACLGTARVEAELNQSSGRLFPASFVLGR